MGCVVDRAYSEKLRKLTMETKMAKKAIKKMHNRLIDSQQTHHQQMSKLARENNELRQKLKQFSTCQKLA